MYINGRNAVLEAIRAGERIEKVYFLYGTDGEGPAAIRKAAKEKGIPCTAIDKDRFRQLERRSGVKTRSQGVIAWINPIFYVDVDDIVRHAYESGHPPLLVALDGVTDPRNVGAIIRSAECAGLDGLAFGKKDSPGINDVVVKTSAGAAHHLPIARADSLVGLLSRVRNSGLTVIGLDERGSASYSEIDLTEPAMIVMGSEGEGLSHNVAQACDKLVSIPMRGKVSSLNVSVAAGVVFFEALRQRSAGSRDSDTPS